MMRFFVFISIICLGILFSGVSPANAADSYRVNNGTTVKIDEHGVCRNVTNNVGSAIFVPTRTATEWATFRSNKPSAVTVTTANETMNISNSCSSAPPVCPSGWTRISTARGSECSSSANTDRHNYTAVCQRAC